MSTKTKSKRAFQKGSGQRLSKKEYNIMKGRSEDYKMNEPEDNNDYTTWNFAMPKRHNSKYGEYEIETSNNVCFCCDEVHSDRVHFFIVRHHTWKHHFFLNEYPSKNGIPQLDHQMGEWNSDKKKTSGQMFEFITVCQHHFCPATNRQHGTIIQMYVGFPSKRGKVEWKFMDDKFWLCANYNNPENKRADWAFVNWDEHPWENEPTIFTTTPKDITDVVRTRLTHFTGSILNYIEPGYRFYWSSHLDYYKKIISEGNYDFTNREITDEDYWSMEFMV